MRLDRGARDLGETGPIWASGHHPSPPRVPSLTLQRTCAGLPPSPGGSRRAALGDQRTQWSRAQGEGAGNFPPRLPRPVNLPLQHRGKGGTAGGIPSRCDGSGEPGLGVLGREGGGEGGTGWDQGRSCLHPQTPAAPACPGLSGHHSRLSRGCGGREWHFLCQARGIRTCGARGMRIRGRVCV